MTSLYPFVVEMSAMLGNLDKWLEKAEAHATANKFEANVLVESRLYPNQYALVRQVQAACDAAKFTGSRLTGKEAPKNPDEEKTVAELRARIKTTVDFLATLNEKDYEGAATRKVPLGFLPGGNKGALGLDYLVSFSQPNFFFHVSHTYAILRHNGVPLGKMDYIGGITSIIDM